MSGIWIMTTQRDSSRRGFLRLSISGTGIALVARVRLESRAAARDERPPAPDGGNSIRQKKSDSCRDRL